MKGFKFPSSFGFTGSTGKVTQVGSYARRKFADGGAVKRVGRMTVTKMGDVGRATVSRAEPVTAEDAATGGRYPLRRGFKDGGSNWIKGAVKHPGALHKALGVAAGKKIPASKMDKAAKSGSPLMRKRVALAKTLKKMH